MGFGARTRAEFERVDYAPAVRVGFLGLWGKTFEKRVFGGRTHAGARKHAHTVSLPQRRGLQLCKVLMHCFLDVFNTGCCLFDGFTTTT